jgi:putative ABC transport system permease protein
MGSGLMLRSFITLLQVDPGYNPHGILTFLLQPPRLASDQERALFMRELSERLSSLPGVQGVTAASPFPLEGRSGSARWGTEQALSAPATYQQADVHFVLPGYFETLQTRLLGGRLFTQADNSPNVKVIIIDHILAAKAFQNQSAIGKRLLARVRTDAPEVFEVIGVVAHQRHSSLAAEGREALYFTDGLMGHGIAMRWAVRTENDPARLIPTVRAVISQINPKLAAAEMQPMQAFVTRARSRTLFTLILIGTFALIAVLLAAVGLYGMLSTIVRLRTSEIGVRMALGATPNSIFRLMIGRGILLSAGGIILGVFASFALTQILTTMLVGVGANDPVTYAITTAIFFIIITVASWLPARRAANLDPGPVLQDGA